MPQPATQAAPEREYSVAEAAAIKGISTKTVRRLISRGDLPAYRLPGSHLIRIRHSDLVALGRRIPSAKAAQYAATARGSAAQPA